MAGDGAPPSLAGLRTGGKRALAAALTAIESRAGTPEIVALLDAACDAAEAGAQVIGLTGPPGVGKSSLTDRLIAAYRAAHLSVGVVAVDPSSARTGGALLGDRTRLTIPAGDPQIFVRSLAARGRLGGLADLAFPTIVLMRALFDRVIVESVGVGQSEAEIAGVTDTVVLCVQPASGDSLQFMKAGIMEIPDIAVVTKADLGAAADRALAELKGAVSLAVGGDWTVACLKLSSSTGDGVTDLIAAIDAHHAWLDAADRRTHARQAQALDWVRTAILERWGSAGAALLADDVAALDGRTPFGALASLSDRIEVRRRA